MRKTGLITAVVAMLLAGSASAEVIVDSTFTSVLGGTMGHGGVIETAQADVGWIANPNVSRMFNRANYDTSTNSLWANWAAGSQGADTSDASALNLTKDDKATTGVQNLNLDVWSGASVNNSSQVKVSLWGYNGDAVTVDGKLAAATTTHDPSGGTADATLLDSMVLAETEAVGVSETQTMQIDLGSGYDYLLVALSAKGGDAAEVRLERVDITPEPATLSLLGLGGLVAMRRRRRA